MSLYITVLVKSLYTPFLSDLICVIGLRNLAGSLDLASRVRRPKSS